MDTDKSPSSVVSSCYGLAQVLAGVRNPPWALWVFAVHVLMSGRCPPKFLFDVLCSDLSGPPYSVFQRCWCRTYCFVVTRLWGRCAPADCWHHFPAVSRAHLCPEVTHLAGQQEAVTHRQPMAAHWLYTCQTAPHCTTTHSSCRLTLPGFVL